MNAVRVHECEYQAEHPVLGEKVRQLEAREDKQDGQIAELRDIAGGIREELSGMRGEIRGALAASKVSGQVIGSIVSLVAGGLIALAVRILSKGG